MKLRAGNVHPLAGLLGMLAATVATLTCAAVFAASFALSGSAGTVFALACVSFAVAVGIAAAGLPLAARALDLRARTWR
jgi:hypothetical protein